jgi:hypothetical protein
MTEEFGIIIACYPGDIWFTRACLSSIKFFAPEIPIALIVDKNPKISDLLPLYNIKYIIRREDVKTPYLRDECFGTRFTSAIALFESPFNKYLYLDSDTIFWGNVCNNVSKMLDEYDFVHNTPHEAYTDFIYKSQYFDYERIFEHLEDYTFEWRGYPYFNSGVMAGKKDVLDLDLFIYLHKLWKRDKKIIFEIQGVVNYIVYYMYSRGNLKVGQMPLQTIIPVFDEHELRSQFHFHNGVPVVNKPTILHYAGLKPMNKSYKGFIEPVNFFRLRHLKQSGKIGRFLGIISLLVEEYAANFNAYYNGSIKKYIRFKLTGKK